MFNFKGKSRSKYNRRSGRVVLVFDRNAVLVGALLTFATALIMG